MPPRHPLVPPHLIALFLRPHELIRFAEINRVNYDSIDSYLSKANEKKDVKEYWEKSLIDLRLDAIEVKKVMTSSSVNNYKHLYGTISSLCYVRWCLGQPSLQIGTCKAWEMLCLSGEVNAVKYAIAYEDLNAKSEGILGNVLHYTARSGSVDAMRVAREIKDINIHALNREGDNVTNLAAESGSVSALELAFKGYKIAGDPYHATRKRQGKMYGEGRHALHSAALGGSFATMRYVVKNMAFLRRGWTINPLIVFQFYPDYYGRSVLKYAVVSKSLDAIDYAINLGLLPKYDDVHGYAFNANYSLLEAMQKMHRVSCVEQNYLSRAISHGTVADVVYAVKECKIPFTDSQVRLMENACATHSPTPELLKKLRLLRGLVHEQNLQADFSIRIALEKAIPTFCSEIQAIVSEPIEDILRSAEYKSWITPYNFKKHSVNREIVLIEQHKKTYVASLVISVVLAVAATIAIFCLPVFPVWIGIYLYVNAGFAMMDALLARRRLFTLFKEDIAPIAVKQDRNISEAPNGSSYVKSLAPIMTISPSASSENGLGPSSEIKRTSRELIARESENKMMTQESKIISSRSFLPG